MPRLLSAGQKAARTRRLRQREDIVSVANAIRLIDRALVVLKAKQRKVIAKRNATRRRNGR